MNTSRSDEQQTSVTQTLGERIVMVARLMGAEHIRQVMDDAGLDLAEIQRQIRARTERQDLFRAPPAPKPTAAATAFADSSPIAMPTRVGAREAA